MYAYRWIYIDRHGDFIRKRERNSDQIKKLKNIDASLNLKICKSN